MRILWLLPHPVFPSDRGNKLHTYNLLRHLTTVHDCELIGFHEPGSEAMEPWEALAAHCGRLKIVGVFSHITGWRLAWERLRCALTLRPLALARYRNPEFRASLEGLDLTRYDVIVSDMYTMAEWRRFCQDRPSILIASDAYSLAALRVVRDARRLRTRLRVAIEAGLQLLFEKREYPGFDIVSTVSEPAAAWLQKHVSGPRYHVVPVAADHHLLASEGREREPDHPVLLCWEGVSHDAVASRVAEFLTRVWPNVRAAVPGAEMVVWGDKPMLYLQEIMRKTAGVRHLGYVPDWRATLQSAGTVFIFPSRSTAGMHIKLMSAFTVGLPVVTSPEACGWFQLVQGQNAYVAETWSEFEKYSIELLSDPARRRTMQAAARRMIAEEFTTTAVGRKMEELLKEAVRLRADRAGPGARAKLAPALAAR